MHAENYYNSLTQESDREAMMSFNPYDFIKLEEGGFALCTNPMADGGLSAITVNTKLFGEGLRNFEASVKRMVLAKMFSPKFGEVILTATRINHGAHA